jgi:hypothetical protein
MAEIESGVALPKPGTKRGRASTKKAAAPSAAAGFIKALQFLSLAQKPQGTAYQTHCLINNHWAVAFDGTLTIGTKIQEDISACPHHASLLAALSKCGAQVAITQLTEHQLSIKSDKFRAVVDCIGFDQMSIAGPDPLTCNIDDRIREGLAALSWIATEGSMQAFKAAVLLQDKSLVATDGSVLLEFWHGFDLGCHLLIPKAATAALGKIDKKLTGFGFSQNSATFYFEDESFLRTLIYVDRYPQYQTIFNAAQGAPVVPMPPDFFKALDAVKEFAEAKFVFFFGNKVQSHQITDKGASYEIEGVPDKWAFDATLLKAVEPHFKNTTFADKKVFFTNGNYRGCVAAGTHFNGG